MRSTMRFAAHLWLITGILLAGRPPAMAGRCGRDFARGAAGLHTASAVHALKNRRPASQNAARWVPRDLIEETESDVERATRSAESHHVLHVDPADLTSTSAASRSTSSLWLSVRDTTSLRC